MTKKTKDYRYTKSCFGQDLYFIIGFLKGGISKGKFDLDKERLKRFEKYCDKHYTDGKGNIK